MRAAPAVATPSAASSPAGAAGSGSTSSTAAAGGSGEAAGGATTDTSTGDAATSSETSGDAGASATTESGEAGESSEAAKDTSGGTYGSDKERIDAAALALEKDDLEGAVRALGRDIKLKGASVRAFKALSVREKKHADRVKRDLDLVNKAKAELQQDSTRASNLLRHADQKYGWIARTEAAWEAQDYVGFAKGIERLAKGASLATITQRIASAGMGKSEPASPEAQALAADRAKLKADQEAWEKQKNDEKAAAEKTKGQQSITEKRTVALGKFGATHIKHPFLANPDDPNAPDPDALKEAFEAYEATWKNGRFEKTPKQVLDELHTREVRKLKRLGITPAAAAQAAPAAKAGTTNGNGTRTPPKRLAEPPATKAARPSLDETRESRVALARRLTEQQTRGLRA
jgi:hypothetical protein